MRIITKILRCIGHAIFTGIKRILGLPFFIVKQALNLIILFHPFFQFLGVIVVLCTWRYVYNALTGQAPFRMIRMVSEIYVPLFFVGFFARKLCKLADCFVNVLWRDGRFESDGFGVL